VDAGPVSRILFRHHLSPVSLLPALKPALNGNSRARRLSMGMGARNVAVSYLLAFAINAFGEKAKYAALMPESSDAAFGFLTAIVFARMVMTLNWYPMEHKSKIMGSHGDLRTNMAVYKAMDAQGAPTGRAIVMDPDGATGEYNRANRSLSHFVEFAPAVLMLLAAAGSVYKLPCFILTLLLACKTQAILQLLAISRPFSDRLLVIVDGRVEHQRGESKNYGSHGNGKSTIRSLIDPSVHKQSLPVVYLRSSRSLSRPFSD